MNSRFNDKNLKLIILSNSKEKSPPSPPTLRSTMTCEKKSLIIYKNARVTQRRRGGKKEEFSGLNAFSKVFLGFANIFKFSCFETLLAIAAWLFGHLLGYLNNVLTLRYCSGAVVLGNSCDQFWRSNELINVWIS